MIYEVLFGFNLLIAVIFFFGLRTDKQVDLDNGAMLYKYL